MSVTCAKCLLPVSREVAVRGQIGTASVFMHPDGMCPNLFDWSTSNFEGLSAVTIENALMAFANRVLEDYINKKEERIKEFMGNVNSPDVYMYAESARGAEIWWGAYLAVEYVARPVAGSITRLPVPITPFRCARCNRYFYANDLHSTSESSEKLAGVTLVDRFGNAYCPNCTPFEVGEYSGKARHCDRCGFVIFEGESVLFDDDHVLHTSCPPALGLTTEEWEAAREYYSDTARNGQLPLFVELEAKRRADYDRFMIWRETYVFHEGWLVDNYRRTTKGKWF